MLRTVYKNIIYVYICYRMSHYHLAWTWTGGQRWRLVYGRVCTRNTTKKIQQPDDGSAQIVEFRLLIFWLMALIIIVWYRIKWKMERYRTVRFYLVKMYNRMSRAG